MRPTELLASAACLLVLATGCAGTPGAHSTPRPSTSPSGTAGPGAGAPVRAITDADNRRRAAAAGVRALRAVRLPPGATRLPGRPRAVPRDAGFGRWPGGATAWYAVPSTRGALTTFLEAHPPRGSRWDGSYGTGPWTSSLVFEPRHQVAPAAYDGPYLNVIWGEVDGRVLVQAHADVRARHVRPPTSYVGSDVTSVLVRRTEPGRNGKARPPVTLTITAPGAVARLRNAVDGLHGSMLVPLVYSCPLFGDPPGTWDLVFRTGGHVLAFHWQQGCGEQVTVSRDGQALPVTLDPGTLGRVVDRVVGQARRG